MLKCCDKCLEPEIVHIGYNQKKEKCLVSYNLLYLNLRFPKMSERDNIINQLKEFHKERERINELEAFIGSGI